MGWPMLHSLRGSLCDSLAFCCNERQIGNRLPDWGLDQELPRPSDSERQGPNRSLKPVPHLLPRATAAVRRRRAPGAQDGRGGGEPGALPPHELANAAYGLAHGLRPLQLRQPRSGNNSYLLGFHFHPWNLHISKRCSFISLLISASPYHRAEARCFWSMWWFQLQTASTLAELPKKTIFVDSPFFFLRHSVVIWNLLP